MSDLIDTFAALSGLRERAALKAAFARLVHDIVQPREVIAYQLGFDTGSCVWTVVHRCASAEAAAPEPGWRRPRSELPVADPEWQAGDAQRHAAREGAWLFALRAGAAVVGAIEVWSEPELTADQHRQLTGLLRFFANLRGLIDENECDALTGLLNRKTFDESFSRIAFAGAAGPARAADAAADDGAPAWHLGVIDIDHFKRINDTHGHLIGDEVLLMLAQRMRATLREGDQIYRFGGEEFVLLLRTRDGGDVVHAFERTRLAVQDQPFPQVGQLTVSVGCTRIRPDDTPSAAFGRADRAVYWVKQNGRNMARAYEQLVQDGDLAAEGETGAVEFF